MTDLDAPFKPLRDMHSTLSAYTRASDIPQRVLDALERYAYSANVILPQIEKSRESQIQGDQLWIVYEWEGEIVYVLGVTEGPMGSYPAFIVTTKRVEELAGPSFDSQMGELARELRGRVDPQRIYSVFAVQPICVKFCDIWAQMTGITIIQGRYYDSLISYCTRQTLRMDNQRPAPHAFKLRLGEPGDIDLVALMCQGFSEESFPFVLDPRRASEEANYLISRGLVWVYMARDEDMDDYEVASIVACTRNTKRVATITKVYTPKEWRRKGCGGRLVRYVCKEVLDQGKEMVALYVGVTNQARKVYADAGFVGLGDTRVEGVDNWIEIGFDRSKVVLGHW